MDDMNKLILSLDNISFAYPANRNNRKVLHDIDLEIRQGEILKINGRNGSGKSTLLKIITGSLEPTKGSRKEHGNIKTVYLNQNASEFLGESLTVQEQLIIGLGKKVRLFSKADFMNNEKLIKENLSKFGINLEKHLHQFTSELSEGQKQVVGLLSVLFNGADLIALDEFSAYMDPETINVSNSLIQHVIKNEKISIIIVSHQLDLSIPISKEVWI